jgi:hypothetical protein
MTKKSPLSLKSFSNLLIDHFDSLNKDEILSKQLSYSVDSTIKMADNPNHLGDVTNGDSQFNEEIIKLKTLPQTYLTFIKGSIRKINVSFSLTLLP